MGTTDTSDKIVPLNELIERVERLRAEGKTVVQSHGVFDIIHPGIVQHLQAAREQGDVLVVTIIRDRDVRRGPGRPIFPEALRSRERGRSGDGRPGRPGGRLPAVPVRPGDQARPLRQGADLP